MSDPNANPTAPGPVSYKDDPEFLPWLKTQEGFKDLFEPPDPKAGAPAPAVPGPVATGGGQTVPANQSADAMSAVVADVTRAVAQGAVAAGIAAAATAAAPVAGAGEPAKKKGFWG